MQKQQLKTKRNDISSYIIEAEIGHGSSGVCYKAISKQDGSICAIKKISINTIKGNSLKAALKQVQVLKQLKHPNIIKYYDSFTDEGYLYIVMQYASKGDLHATLKKRKIKQQMYTEAQIWNMGKQLLEALKYLHSKNIVHRDFKTLNIFISEKNNLLVGDLGVSKIMKNDMGLYSRVGTPLYLAPEIIKYEKYDYKADIWGFGCVLYLISSLTHPFEGKNIVTLGQNILHNDPKPIQHYSDELNSLLKSALEKNPNKRPQAKFLLSLYFTPEQDSKRLAMQKQDRQKEKQKIQLSSKLDLSKTDIELRREKPLKLNTYAESNMKKKDKSPEKIFYQKSHREKQKMNTQDRQLLNDETIILIPNVKMEVTQEKTRVRALFHNSKVKIISNHLINDNSIIESKNVQLIKQPQKQKQKQFLWGKGKGQAEKVQTEAPEIPQRQEMEINYFLKNRKIQSAKAKPQMYTQKEYYSSCQKFDKQTVVGSLNKMFFESGIEQQRKTYTRPKSGMGRKALVSNNEIKFIKRRNTSQEQKLLSTKTEMLKKPEVIII